MVCVPTSAPDAIVTVGELVAPLDKVTEAPLDTREMAARPSVNAKAIVECVGSICWGAQRLSWTELQLEYMSPGSGRTYDVAGP